jgi:hypothetical protein
MANVAKINGYDVKDAEARGDIADIQQALSTAQGDITTLQGDVLNTESDLGDITALSTTVKTSAVNAINEVDSHADANTINIGNLAALNTVDKSDIVSAINEVERNASYGISKNTYNFAPTFSDETSYAVGDYVTYNGVLYKCTTAHSASAWVAGHFTQVTVGGIFGELSQTVTVTLNIGYGIVVKKSGHTVFVSWALNNNIAINTIPLADSIIATGLPKPITVQTESGSTPSSCLNMSGGNGKQNPDVNIIITRDGELHAYNGSGSVISSTNVGAYLVYYTDD